MVDEARVFIIKVLLLCCRTQIEGLDIHFLRAAAGDTGGRKDVKVVPLLLVHGWPGSVIEFYGILPLLTTPRDDSSVVFEVICPSIPGYGFSQGSSKPGKEAPQPFTQLLFFLQHSTACVDYIVCITAVLCTATFIGIYYMF